MATRKVMEMEEEQLKRSGEENDAIESVQDTEEDEDAKDGRHNYIYKVMI